MCVYIIITRGEERQRYHTSVHETEKECMCVYYNNKRRREAEIPYMRERERVYVCIIILNN